MSRAGRRETAVRRRSRPGTRATRALGGFLAACLSLTIVLTGGVYLRLTQGPIELARFAPMIEAELKRLAPDMGLSFSAAELALGDDGRARLQVRDFVLFHDADKPLMRAPMVAGAFSVADLLRGEVHASDVVVGGVAARLVRDETGRFILGFGGETEDGLDEAEGQRLFRELLAASTSAPAEGEVEEPRRSQRLILRDASLLYIDRQSRRAWRARDVDMSFRASRLGLEARAEGVLAGGRYGEMRMSMNGYRAENGDVYLSAEIDNAAPADIAAQIGALDWLEAFDAPVDGEMRLALDENGQLTQMDGRLAAGAGVIALGDGSEPLERAEVAFAYETVTGRFRVEEARLVSPRATASAVGFVEVGRDEAGEPRDIVAQLDLTDLTIAAPEALHQPLSYDMARVTGRLTLDPLLIELGELRLEQGPLAMTAAGYVELTGEDVRSDIAIAGSGMTVPALMAHWPLAAAPGAREWILENMESADITDFDASIRLGDGADDVKFDFSFENAVGHYLRPMPPITDAVGAGQVDLKRFALKVDAGVVTPEGGEPLDIAGSSFVIADLEHPDTPATIDLLVEGRLADALEIVDHEPLGFIGRLGLPLNDPGGQVSVRTAVTLPLLKALLLEDVQAAAEAEISNLRVSLPALDGPLTAAQARLTADTSAFSLSGAVGYQGLVGRVDWRETFATGARAIKIDANVSAETLVGLGVEAPWIGEGAAAVAAQLDFPERGPTVDAVITLDDLALQVDEIGWAKPRGQEAKLEGRIVLTEGEIRSPRYKLSSRDLELEGNVRLTEAGELLRFRFDKLLYRGGADLEVVGRMREDRWNIQARGPLLDLTRFPDLIEGGDTGRGVPLRLKLEIGRLQLRPKLHLADADGVFFLEEDGAVRGGLGGLVEGAGPFRLDVESGPAGGEVRVTSQNAGKFLRAAGVFGDGSGGDLDVRARIEGAEDLRFTGEARLDNIVIHEDAKLEQLLAGAELEELQIKMRTDGIVFDRIRAPFSYAEGRVTTTEAVAHGSAIGVNISGAYDLEADSLAIDGVFTPVYALNSAFGEIPLLGALLTGGDGQGLFAFNFSVNGPAEDPSVSVNPLSILTPGVFRRIFSLDGADASSRISSTNDETADR